MGHFASGVTIATALHHGVKHAMTATAVCSVSLEPPLVLVCVSKSSRFHGAIIEAKYWCLSAADRRPGAARPALLKPRTRPADQFDDVPHIPSPSAGRH